MLNTKKNRFFESLWTFQQANGFNIFTNDVLSDGVGRRFEDSRNFLFGIFPNVSTSGSVEVQKQLQTDIKDGIK